MTALLRVRDLSARYGLLPVLHHVSLDVAAGEVLALVGANGAGKSTLLRTVAGAHAAAAGTVSLDGADITALAAHRRVALGIALVPEGRRLFATMTVEENLLVAGGRARWGPWRLESVLEALPMVKPLLRKRASALSGGEQQVTSIARALMTNPRVLLVDEVSLGLSPAAVELVYESLRAVKQGNATLVLVEQALDRALSLADRVLCLREGRVVLSDAAHQVTRETVADAYFGHTPAMAVRP